jgi:ferredoxin
MPYVITIECNQCGTCAAGCEGGAIQEGQDQNTINVTICIECGICAANCPFEAIFFEEEVSAQSLA